MSDGSVHDVPGGVDPVFTPDGKFLTLPGGKFIEMAEIQNQIDRNRPADNVEPAVNAHQNGVYQSIGILPGSTEKKKTYRYMNDNSVASSFDVEVKFDDNGKVTGYDVKKDLSRLCSEASSRDTPMMSK